MTDQAHKTGKARLPYTIFGLLVSGVALWWLLADLDLSEIRHQIASVRRFELLVAIFLTIISYLLRAWRWPFFFKFSPPRFEDSYRCLIVGFFMNNILPARLGELVRAHLGGKATNQSRAHILATIASERLADGLTISLVFAILFSLGASPAERLHGDNIYLVCYLFAAAGICTLIFLSQRHLAFKLLSRLQSVLPGRLSSYGLDKLHKFIEGLEPLLRLSRVPAIVGSSLLVWAIELLVYYYVSRAFNQNLSIGALSLFLAAVNFSSLIPAAPGGVGVIEVFATLALEHIGLDREVALAMVATQHVIQWLVVGIPGAFFFIFRMGGKIPNENEETLDSSIASSRAHSTSPKNEFKEISQLSSDAELDLSIVIPAYNEEARLPATLNSATSYLNNQTIAWEILVVDDGSGDNTSKVVLSHGDIEPRIRLLTYPQNRGKGYAVKLGCLNAIGSQVVFYDADGATPIEEIARLQQAIDGGADVAIGSRALNSEDTSVKTVWYRKLLGRMFNSVVNLVILPGIADTQCGCKMFRLPVARYIFGKQTSEKFSFDVEVLFIARKAGFQIQEIPVNWTNIEGSKVNLIQDALRMFRDILVFRIRHLLGRYNA